MKYNLIDYSSMKNNNKVDTEAKSAAKNGKYYTIRHVTNQDIKGYFKIRAFSNRQKLWKNSNNTLPTHYYFIEPTILKTYWYMSLKYCSLIARMKFGLTFFGAS